MIANIPDPLPEQQVQPAHILVVEDKIILRYMLAQWLRILGYAVLEAASASEALELFSSPLAVDLVVSDVHMPGAMDGIGLAHYIHTAYPDIPVILVSGEAKRHELDTAPAAACFIKPYDLHDIATRIDTLLTESKKKTL